MQEHIEIPLSKTKLFFLELGSIAFVATSLWILLGDIDPGRYNPYVLKAVAIIGIAFFGVTTIYGAIKLFDNKPGLKLTNEGIIDNSSALSIGLVRWDDIQSFKVVNIMSTKLLKVHVKNPDYYIDLQESGWKRRLMNSNHNMYGSPISISSNSLKIKFKKLENLLNGELNKRGTKI